MRLLVTGGAGFIGSHFVRSVIGGERQGLRDAHVTVLDKLTYMRGRAGLAPVEGSRRLTARWRDMPAEALRRPGSLVAARAS